MGSTWAGDCFNGAFLAALCEGADLGGCLRFACAAASFAVAQLGARGGIASRARVDGLLAPGAPGMPEPLSVARKKWLDAAPAFFLPWMP